MPSVSRRSFLAGSAAAASLALADPLQVLAAWAEELPLPGSLRKAERLGSLPFVDEGSPAFDQIRGVGLAARRAFDLGSLDSEGLIVPQDRFFVRTATPDLLPDPGFWRLGVRALQNAPEELSMEDLAALSEPMGAHLLSCVENGPEHRFGLVSAAEWSGVPLAKLFQRTGLPEGSWLLLVEGFDRHSTAPPGPEPGAGWVFKPGDLTAAGAFLATGMNGEPLAPEHGAPLRLVVPGWHGCTWIKWVYTLIFLPADAATPSPQMKEYASRLGLSRVPRRARSYPAAALGWSAVPVRVEEWRRRRRTYVRVVGAAWGGQPPSPKLLIRLRPEDSFEAVESAEGKELPHQTWSLWSHTFRVKDPGKFRIELAFQDPQEGRLPSPLAKFARSFQLTEGA